MMKAVRPVKRVEQVAQAHVYKDRYPQAGKPVVIKWIPGNEIANSAMKYEIEILKQLKHGNIVRLLDVLETEDETYLVLEYLELDMDQLIMDPKFPMSSELIKKFLYQILCGVAHCHSHNILHRHVRPKYLLVELRNHVVKLSEFGWAKQNGLPFKEYSRAKDATLGYTAPELLLLNAHHFTAAGDVWSVGCIFGEMVIRRPLFSRRNAYDQLVSISSLLGTPNEENWPGVTKFCRGIRVLGQMDPKILAEEFPGLEGDGVDLLSKMLCWDPSKRITAHDALEHDYFNDIRNSPCLP